MADHELKRVKAENAALTARIRQLEQRIIALEDPMQLGGPVADYEVCPVCNYCKRKDHTCLRCAFYCPQPGQHPEPGERRLVEAELAARATESHGVPS